MALLFSRDGNYVNLGTGLNVTGNAITMSAWVLLHGDVGPADSRIIAKGVGTGIDQVPWSLRVSSSNDRAQVGVRVGGSGELSTLAGAPTLAKGVWIHYVGIYNNGIFEIWLDGVQEHTDTATAGNIDTNADETWLGEQPTTNNRPLNGKLEDVRVYDRALRSFEIQTLYATRGADGIVDGLLHRYPCQDHAPGVIAGSVTDIIGGQSGVGVAGGAAAAPEFVTGITKQRRCNRHPVGVL